MTSSKPTGNTRMKGTTPFRFLSVSFVSSMALICLRYYNIHIVSQADLDSKPRDNIPSTLSKH